MGSKERLERAKDKVREDILEAAMHIAKTEGWKSISMRKIAESIEYSTPIIYSYFLNKEAVLIELTNRGYVCLNNHIEHYIESVIDPRERLEMVLIAFVDFAIKEKELYWLIYDVGASLSDVRKTFPGLTRFTNIFKTEMENVKGQPLAGEEFQCKYFSFISFVHGLVSVNYYFKDINQAMNDKILKEGMAGMINSLCVPARV